MFDCQSKGGGSTSPRWRMVNREDMWVKLNKTTRKAAKYPTKKNIAAADIAKAEYLQAHG